MCVSKVGQEARRVRRGRHRLCEGYWKEYGAKYRAFDNRALFWYVVGKAEELGPPFSRRIPVLKKTVENVCYLTGQNSFAKMLDAVKYDQLICSIYIHCETSSNSIEGVACLMKILVFTEGTIFIHERWANLPREEIVKLVKSWSGLSREQLEKLKNSGAAPGLGDYAGSVPIGDCVEKILNWKKQGATIIYLTSRTKPEEIQIIKELLKKYSFPEGELLFRKAREEYKDVAERAFPDVIVEDDCESIGGESEMTYPRIKPEMKAKIKSVVVREFGGIDHLPDNITELLRY